MPAFLLGQGARQARAAAIREADRLGYKIFWSAGAAYFRCCGIMGPRAASEPFETLDAAAYAALADHELVAALARDVSRGNRARDAPGRRPVF